MRLASNEHYALALQELGGVDAYNNPEWLDLVKDRCHVISATQLVEDMNGCQSISSLKPCRRFRRPVQAMAEVLKHDLPGVKHRYDAIEVRNIAPARGVALPKSSFETTHDECSMDFNGIVSFKQATSWYSPNAERMTTPCADSDLIRQAVKAKNMDFRVNAWMGEMCDVSNRLAIGFVNKTTKKTSWFICLHHWPKSACMMWPAVLKACGNQWWFHIQASKQAVVRPILSLDPDEVQFASFKWRSWLWQLHTCQATLGTLKPAVRPFMQGQSGSFMAVASKAVFWNLSQVQVAKYAARLLEGYTPKHNMFDLLWHVLGKVLKLADPELLALIHQRVVKIEFDDNQEILLHVDEAMEVLDEQDQKLLTKGKGCYVGW